MLHSPIDILLKENMLNTFYNRQGQFSKEERLMEIKTFDPFNVYAFCLFDASAVFPAALRDRIRTPYKAKTAFIHGPIITGMCTMAHEALYSVDPASADHYWAEDTSTGEIIGGNLPKALSAAAQNLSVELKAGRHERAVAWCGRLSHLLIDSLVGVNLIEFEHSVEVRGRIAQDLTDHIQDLPFVWDGVLEGDNFVSGSPIMIEERATTFLVEHRQVSINVANAYLHGNGWPAARGQLEKCYNRAANVLARTVFAAEE